MLRRIASHIRTIIILLTLFAVGRSTLYASGTPCDSVKHRSVHWIKQLIDNGFMIHDTTVCYPAFPRFALNVYNWGDRTFNSYDTDYVVGTGMNWKLQGKAYGWMESQTMLFPKNSRISMHSDLFMDAGAYISFMAVSVGYMWNMDKLFDRDTKRHTFMFDFTCSRFSINYNKVSSEGGMILTHFGGYNDNHDFRHKFDDISVSSVNLDAYYFFNHRRYSHAAAYSYSKYQLKSAGTAIVGLNYADQDFRMDFSNLPPAMLEYLPLDDPKYTFHHYDVAALGGYGHNWVLKPRRWLVNLTAMGAIGYKRTFQDATDGRRNLLANNYKISSSLVYNHRKLFASAQAKFNGYLFFNSSFTHFSTFSSLTLTVGMRF